MCPSPADAPRGTYRLQLGPDLTFADAAGLAGYLHDLGVSHVYLSPILTAVPGSTHGYDVTDHSRVRDEIGGRDGFLAMRRSFREHGLGVVVDVVPNHMAVPVPEYLNAPLWSVLERGRESPFADWFDIDWQAQGGRILMPVLAGPLETCLGDMSVGQHDGRPVLRYFDHVLPLVPGTETLPMSEALETQHYRLCDWRFASNDLNYRRFCDITSLIALRVEDPDVFDATHRVLLDLVAQGHIDGLRIDHPDGLADPAGYLQRLHDATGGAWVVVEKILAADEELPADWACAGTTGYDALARVTELLLDPSGEEALSALYGAFTGEETDAHVVEREGKRLVATRVLDAEVSRLIRVLDGDERTREAIVELVVWLDVYRAYATSYGAAALAGAVEAAASARPDLDDALRLVHEAVSRPGEAAIRFEQLCAAAQAKGVEDTAFYRYARLLALNEVGCDPGRFGLAQPAFHAWCERAQRDHPLAMTTLSTHDTKRGEDVRARLSALAQVPGDWETAVRRWQLRAAKHGPPDDHVAYFFWQTLVGTWPLDTERVTRYLNKAIHEAKRVTTWREPNAQYDDAVERFAAGVLADDELLADVERFVGSLERPARAISLTQKLLQATMPGVPDTYQGAESVNRRLVDPDNRGPVDFARLRESLTTLADDKQRVTAIALRLRRDHPHWFSEYRPMSARGAAADHAVAFARSAQCIVVAARFTARLEREGGWRDTTLALPEGDWIDALSGVEHEPGDVPLAELLRDLPGALLVPAVTLEEEVA